MLGRPHNHSVGRTDYALGATPRANADDVPRRRWLILRDEGDLMHFTGELCCVCCGYVAGEIVGDDRLPLSTAQLKVSRHGPGVVRRAGERPRCGRCGGRLLVEPRDVIYFTPAREPARTRQPV
jgi:hypothetical protein